MAPVWGWILAYLLGFLVFQAVVYWYLQGDRTSVEEPTPGYGDGELTFHPTVDGTDERSEAADGTIRCPHCGAYNDREAAYRYCRDCVRELR